LTAWIWSGVEFSNGAKLLSRELGIKRIPHSFIGTKVKQGDVIINWGGTNLPMEHQKYARQILNEPLCIRRVSNKLTFFDQAHPVCRTVPHFTDKGLVQTQLVAGKKVMARTLLNGHSGKGIVLIEKEVDIVDAPLYTVYIPKKFEFRIHIVNSDVVDIQRKIKRPDFKGEVDWHIRNHSGGFIYVRNGVRDLCPQDCIDQALLAMDAVDLQFGAVDVIYNEKDSKAYVLEINSAPGLEGTTVKLYADALRKNFGEVLHL